MHVQNVLDTLKQHHLHMYVFVYICIARIFSCTRVKKIGKKIIYACFASMCERNGCKKLKDCILQAAEVHFASGVVSGACIVNGAKKSI